MNRDPRHPAAEASEAEQGFTLLELVVAMGLLTGFLLMLVRLLGTGVSLFDEGERGQELLDRAQAAARAARDAVSATTGPQLVGRPGGHPDARLLVHEVTLAGTQVPVLRSTVRLAPAHEEALLRAAFAARAREDGASEQRTQEIVEERLRAWPRTGRGEMVLLPWPAGEDGVFWNLRQGERLADPLLLEPEATTLLELAAPEDLVIEPEQVLASTEVVATGLLHFEIELWSQRTKGWDAIGATGAERTWDSARAGLLTSERESPSDFGLDLGPSSLDDPRDDVWPQWVRLTLVVARSPTAPPESRLSKALAENDKTLVVSRPEELPDPAENPWLKVGSEWIRFSNVSGSVAHGLRRGSRGTERRAHAAGTPVRVGRLVVVHVPLTHGRNGDD